MGSIADLLGDQLRAGLAQLVDPDASDEAPGAAPASSSQRENAYVCIKPLAGLKS